MMEATPLYDPADEHDACGVGVVASINGHASRMVVEKAIDALKAVFHRGALNADGKTGDGAGVMTAMPVEFFRREIERIGKRSEKGKVFAVGMMFLPRKNLDEQEQSRVIVESEVLRCGFNIYGWRQVPVNTEIIGESANEHRPEITQLLLECGDIPDDDVQGFLERVERELYVVRKRIEKRILENGIKQFYVCSLSCKTITYKGLFKAEQLALFYPDLNDERFSSSFALFHQRFSTNTSPVWHLAQPFRTLAHNGEINTLRGNVNWMRTHEASMESNLFGELTDEIKPVIPDDISDTGALDAAMELLVRAGRPIPFAKHVLIPPAWSKDPNIPARHKAFFHYCNCIMSPWDGPAAITATDGRWVIAGMDRNGLRPMRYTVTRDGLFCAGSESGMIPIDSAQVRMAGRLGPGEIIAIDLHAGQLYHDTAIKDWLSSLYPYEEWEKGILPFDEIPVRAKRLLPKITDDILQRRQLASGITHEDVELLLKPMVMQGKEGVGSMGDDTPISVLSKHCRGLHHYFRQRFSQVTNPPIDPLREASVMSLMTRIGNRSNFLGGDAEQMELIEIESPILLTQDMDRLIKYLKKEEYSLHAVFDADKEGEMERTIKALKDEMDAAFEKGKRHFVVTDEKTDATHAAVPMAMLVSALHHHMIERGLRKQITILVRCGEVIEVHHAAVLIGLGATVINPYIAQAAIEVQHKAKRYGAQTLEECVQNYKAALEAGLLKIMSKMGISVISSYRGGTIFEIIGLSRALVDTYFPGSKSRISGIGVRGIESRLLERHRSAWSGDHPPALPIGGFLNYRKEGENHAYSGETVELIQQATKNGSYQTYKRYSEKVEKGPTINLRDLLAWRSDRSPIEIKEVEPVSEIRKRFIAPAMSLGALSPEAHEVLAVAMNRIGAFSNSGEGGEGPERYYPNENGDNANSRIKQVASGRFGVTADYLNHCDEIQIKVAQGAKPGEGGQLPGFKVTTEIARLRHATPGVTLISPPPHHDIYSIEDLAQLIYDLKQINPDAVVSVKLVAQSGIGTIASGVAKAYADKILISGHSGGTGASPFSSIKHAGIPWEMGLSEAHHVLMLNRLRHRVKLQTDGGIKTGRDIVIAAMLGAEEYGIGTLSLIAMGCLLVRQCQNNTCPVGVCTQDERLREKFEGSVESVIHLMSFIAEEVREILAELGYSSLQDIVGRGDLLHQVYSGSDDMDSLDLGVLLSSVDNTLTDGKVYPRHATIRRNDVAETLDHELLDQIETAMQTKEKVQMSSSIRNTQRSIGTRISSLICRMPSYDTFSEDHITLTLRGSAGQSLGAFAVNGLKLEVVGDANDYVGKGLSGGLLVLRPPRSSKLQTHQQTIIGNTCLYGATSGRLFAAGQAGERFAVRNSGAHTVVEGAGTNACEYMTGGVVVILGAVGNNFAAGMTGGMAYVFDPDNTLPTHINEESVVYQPLQSAYWEAQLKEQLAAHIAYTESSYAAAIFDNWDSQKAHFWQICPKEMIAHLTHPLSDSEHAMDMEAG